MAIDVPGPLLLQNIEALKDTPDLYQTIKGLLDYVNSQTAYLQATSTTGPPPQGPQSVTAAQLDGTIKVSWQNEESGCLVKSYGIWRAPAGNRFFPTTPAFDAAVRVDNIPAQDVSCLPVGSSYGWIDKNFTITEKDPANPVRKQYWVTTIDESNNESIPIPSGPIEVPLAGPGDLGPGVMDGQFNRLWNSVFYNPAVTTVDRQLPYGFGVIGATNTAPISITTSSPHGYSTGDFVNIIGAGGNVAANGYWQIGVSGASTFNLSGSNGTLSGVFSGGGGCVKFDGQPAPDPLRGSDGGTTWSPWFTNNNGVPVKFRSDFTVARGEIYMTTPIAGDSNLGTLQQAIDISRFIAGQHIAISIFVKLAFANPSGQFFKVWMQGVSSTPTVWNTNVLNTTTYTRLVFNTTVPTTLSGLTFGKVFLIFQLDASNALSTPKDVIVTRPMVNAGNNASSWSGFWDNGFTVGQTATGIVDPSTPTFARSVNDLIMRDPTVPYV